jgi:hypothetical protein
MGRRVWRYDGPPACLQWRWRVCMCVYESVCARVCMCLIVYTHTTCLHVGVCVCACVRIERQGRTSCSRRENRRVAAVALVLLAL